MIKFLFIGLLHRRSLE